ncbi:MAG: hypothetical protein ACRDN6_04715 [Gaiellaceae bacterium]
MKRLLALGAVLWLGRWLLLELASYAGRHWLPPGPPARDSPRQPGRLPGPFDRRRALERGTQDE